MKIVQRWDKNHKTVSQVPHNVVFELEGNTYLRLDNFNTHSQNYNALNLSSGKFSYLQPGFKVEVFPDAELHLK